MGTGVSLPFHVQAGLAALLGLPAQILGGLEEQEFPQTAQYSDVFNDTSVHWFPVQKLKRLPTDTWASREEPDYRDCEDLEIIRRQAGASATRPPSADPGANRKPSA